MGRRKKRPLLSLAMMVKDEERFLGEALESAAPWVDEMIVVDTGSRDRTIEIARAHGAIVSSYVWNDDFSAARNETLRRANGGWILILDADERLAGEDPKALRDRLAKLSPGYPFQVLMLEVVNTTLEAQVLSTFSSVRILPNDERLGYRQRVHNVFGSLDPEHQEIHAHRYEGLRIIHLGYDPRVYRERKKAERSLPLIERVVAEEPDNFIHRYYLGREYYSLGRVEDAIRTLSETVRGLIETDSKERDVLLDAWWHLIEALRKAKRPLPEVLETAKLALERFPQSADLWHATAGALIDSGQLEESVRILERTLACMRLADAGVSRINHVGDPSMVQRRLGQVLGELGKFPEAYRAYLAALAEAPKDLEVLNCALGLAIDLGDARLDELLEKLLAVPDAPLEMFFIALARREKTEGTESARRMLEGAAEQVHGHPGYPEWARKLGRSKE